MDPKFFLRYTNIYVARPSVNEDLTEKRVTPHECRLRDLTYSAPVYVDVRYQRGSVPVVVKHQCIGRIPIMLRSRKCWLRGKGDRELEEVKECPYDPGGYFIVKGVEKVCLIQEQLSKNRIILETDAKDNICASVTSSTHERKSRTVIGLAGGRLHLQHNTIGDDVPIVVLLRALGVTSDQEICSLLGPEPELHDALQPSLEEAAALGIFSGAQALDYIGGKVQAKRTLGRSNLSKVDEARNVMASVVLNHVPVVRFNFRPKALYVCHMVRRILLCSFGRVRLDDKDYYGNKRLELAGQLISLLFEDLFKRCVGGAGGGRASGETQPPARSRPLQMSCSPPSAPLTPCVCSFNGDIKRTADMVLSKPNRADQFDVLKHIRTDTITNGASRRRRG